MSATSETIGQLESSPLEAVLSQRYALTPRHVAVCGWFCLLFMYFNYVPLFQTDLWGHVLHGQWIIDHRALPAEDPFQPLAAGMRQVDTSWLSQVMFAQVESWGGAQFLSNLYALTLTFTYILLARVFYHQSGRLSLALGGVALALALGWTRHAIIRPEIFGGLSFAVLLYLVVHAEPWKSRRAKQRSAGLPWLLWLGVPLLFVFWANAARLVRHRVRSAGVSCDGPRFAGGDRLPQLLGGVG